MGGRSIGLGCWVLKLDRTKSVGCGWGKNENHKKFFFIYKRFIYYFVSMSTFISTYLHIYICVELDKN